MHVPRFLSPPSLSLSPFLPLFPLSPSLSLASRLALRLSLLLPLPLPFSLPFSPSLSRCLCLPVIRYATSARDVFTGNP